MPILWPLRDMEALLETLKVLDGTVKAGGFPENALMGIG